MSGQRERELDVRDAERTFARAMARIVDDGRRDAPELFEPGAPAHELGAALDDWRASEPDLFE